VLVSQRAVTMIGSDQSLGSSDPIDATDARNCAAGAGAAG
jgi:hypothetical protein